MFRGFRAYIGFRDAGYMSSGVIPTHPSTERKPIPIA